jgi:hypothetical protein
MGSLVKFGHFAAIALAGWILMAPSIDCARKGLQRETPMSEWEQVDSFTSQEGCESYRAVVIAAEKDDSGNIYVARYTYSTCVREDDPRIKGSSREEPNP